MTRKIISWNVNGIRACAKKGLESFVKKEDPDLFCVQETKAHPDQLDSSLLTLAGRKGHFSSAYRKGYSGTATFCKSDPAQVSHGIAIRKFDFEGRFVVTDHSDFLLYNVYFPNGGASQERHDFKQEFLKKFTHHLNMQFKRGREIVLVGDYNVAYLDHDVYDPVALNSTSGFLPEEREWFQSFLKSGFTDTFRHLHPDETQKYSWWSYKESARVGNRGWRIDHICVTEGLKNKIQRAEVMSDVEGSDHCPVLLELKC